MPTRRNAIYFQGGRTGSQKSAIFPAFFGGCATFAAVFHLPVSRSCNRLLCIWRHSQELAAARHLRPERAGRNLSYLHPFAGISRLSRIYLRDVWHGALRSGSARATV